LADNKRFGFFRFSFDFVAPDFDFVAGALDFEAPDLGFRPLAGVIASATPRPYIANPPSTM
jgi:hypothetical protein